MDWKGLLRQTIKRAAATSPKLTKLHRELDAKDDEKCASWLRIDIQPITPKLEGYEALGETERGPHP